jgi:hypothetical protein
MPFIARNSMNDVEVLVRVLPNGFSVALLSGEHCGETVWKIQWRGLSGRGIHQPLILYPDIAEQLCELWLAIFRRK